MPLHFQPVSCYNSLSASYSYNARVEGNIEHLGVPASSAFPNWLILANFYGLLMSRDFLRGISAVNSQQPISAVNLTVECVSKDLSVSSRELRLRVFEPSFRKLKTTFVRMWIQELAAAIFFEFDVRVGILDGVEPCPISPSTLLSSGSVYVVLIVGFLRTPVPPDPREHWHSDAGIVFADFVESCEQLCQPFLTCSRLL
jgi:hypothetical protein